MSILKRIGWYLGGFSIGLIFLAFFLKKKKTEFCYGIDCRILKNIRSKNIVYATDIQQIPGLRKLDSVLINKILSDADVNMSKSNTKLDSCKVYLIESEFETKPISLLIENCEKTATIKKITIE